MPHFGTVPFCVPSKLRRVLIAMKPMLKWVPLLLVFLATCNVLGQVTDQPNQPSAPQDRIPVADELNASSDRQPITLKVSGAHLRDSVGSPVGRIENLIVDPNSGQVDFLIVAPFFPTNGTKIMAIPWKTITYRAEQSGMGSVPGGNQVFALTFPRTKLQQAPSFERYRWPDMSQQSWRQSIYSFYSGTGPAAGATATQSFSGTGAGAGGPLERQSNSTSAARSVYSNDFIGPRIQSVPGATTLTNSALTTPTAPRSGSSTPDNRLPIGARFGR